MNNEKGFVFLLFTVVIIALLSVAGLATDFGFTYWQKKTIQVAVDAGALAGVNEINQLGATSSSVVSVAQAVAQANGLEVDEITQGGGISTGIWSGANNIFTPSTDMTLVNAVRAYANREVGTFFARIIGFNSVTPKVISIAVIANPSSSDCPVPFGIEQPVLSGLSYGDEITITRSAPGNWGKLDIGGNMSSRPNFIDAMISNSCGNEISSGDNVMPAPGFAGVTDGFDQRLAINPKIIMTIVEGFPNGGSQPVVVRGFVVLEIISTQGNGAKWTATLRFLNEYTGDDIGGPAGPPYAKTRVLVR